MKYFEVDRPCYALVKASTPSEAISLYVRDISDADDDEGVTLLELTVAKAFEKVKQSKIDSVGDALDVLKNFHALEPTVILVDASL